MRSSRQIYYDLFSRVYDTIIRLHSRDRVGSIRGFIKDRVMIGPTIPVSSILFDYGIDVICGTKVIDLQKLIRSISEGATLKEVSGVRLLTLTRT
jgi:uncharacterized protein (DUF4213/DUF364 family)